jgi:hypothetical protein
MTTPAPAPVICQQCNRSGPHWFACPALNDPPPYDGPIWNHKPTLGDWASLPLILAWMGATSVALWWAGFLLNPCPRKEEKNG